VKPKEIMLIAGEASGDMLGADLVEALRQELTSAEIDYTPDLQPLRTGLEPRFFGAGGARMKAAGVDLAFDLTEHAIIGIPTAKQYFQLRRRFRQLVQLALERQPDVIIGIDYNHFNLRFATAIRSYVKHRSGWFQDWQPKLVKYISPQVWASREDRAYEIARDYHLLLSIFPFEKEWYARHAPKLRVEFVGHPMVDNFHQLASRTRAQPPRSSRQQVLLLPGSRKRELRRHVPVMLGALKLIQEKCSAVCATMILPSESLAELAKSLGANVEIQVGGVPEALAESDLAITKTGTIATECAFFQVPAVTLYKVSWMFYELGKRVVKVNSLTMPNLLAGEEVFPEFIQNAATPENIARAALDLLENEARRNRIKNQLSKIVASLGPPGASRRAAQAVCRLLGPQITHRLMISDESQERTRMLTH
jgi:lipid-A-disaccharide synthase